MLIQKTSCQEPTSVSSRRVAAMTMRHPSQHSHGYLTSLRGILLLHQATGDPALLAQVEKEWEGLMASGNVFVQGAVPEAFKPIADRDEGCSELRRAEATMD